MADAPVHERLRLARAACGLELETLARRSGIRVDHLRAVEEGRFADLQHGIYARSAVRTFAAAVSLDPQDVLIECDALLPGVEDPIAALGRIRGIRPVSSAPVVGTCGTIPPPPPGAWSALGAAVLDACVSGCLLTIVVLSTAVLAGVRPHVLAPAAPILSAVGLVLAAAYFLWFGGLAGSTPGATAMRLLTSALPATPLTLELIATHAWRAATRDVHGLRDLGIASRARWKTSFVAPRPQRAAP